MTIYQSFQPEEIKALSVPMKLGVLATVNPQGLPHMTLLSTLQPYEPQKMIWGQFVEGLSKEFIRKNPKTGFMIMTLDKCIWRGKATFTETKRSGAEYDMYNNIPMFRYNAYFGVHTVFYMDLVEQYGKEPLPMGQVITSAILTMLAKSFSKKRNTVHVLNRWSFDFINVMDNLKFLSYVDQHGYPTVIPAIQTQAVDREHLIFAGLPFSSELQKIPVGVQLAVFSMSLQMEAVLMRGKFLGLKRVAGIPCGEVQLNWVYNCMPPKPQQIYPMLKVEPVRNFI